MHRWQSQLDRDSKEVCCCWWHTQVDQETEKEGKCIPKLSASRQWLGFSICVWLVTRRHAQSRHPVASFRPSPSGFAGFCSETEEEHQDTLDLMRKTQYDQAFMFAYSEREKTHASRHLQDDVPAEVKSRRLQEIIAAFREGQLKQFQAEVGRTHLVSYSCPAWPCTTDIYSS